MTAYALLPYVIVLLGTILVGHLVIQAIGFGLPRSRSLSEWWDRTFWVYRPDIPKEQIRRNKWAYLLVVIVAYLIANVYLGPPGSVLAP